MPSGRYCVLVVFGGHLSQALVADFAKVNKQFMGSSPTCLSTMHLRKTMKIIGGPIVWGRDDLGKARETVYRRNEQPFY